MHATLPIAAIALAAANGANDNFKGVATLFGSGATRYRGALLWATITTLAGSAASIVAARGLVKAFTGAGLLPAAAVGDPAVAVSAGLAAALTVGFAAWRGLPISTTHALLGGMIGAGATATSGELHGGVLTTRFVAPLLASPVLALAGTAVLYPAMVRMRMAFRVGPGATIGVEAYAATRPDAAVALAPMHPRMFATRGDRAPVRMSAGRFGVSARRILDLAHLASAGLVSFARGLNDTPKIAALLVAGASFGSTISICVTALAIAAGGWWGARRVAETMSHRITSMNQGQGFTANLVTAVLVIFASRLALPVSTTHVSVGALIGMGVVTSGGRWRVIRPILLSWVATLPIAAALGALFCFSLGGNRP